jgi:hypothetical protein
MNDKFERCSNIKSDRALKSIQLIFKNWIVIHFKKTELGSFKIVVSWILNNGCKMRVRPLDTQTKKTCRKSVQKVVLLTLFELILRPVLLPPN